MTPCSVGAVLTTSPSPRGGRRCRLQSSGLGYEACLNVSLKTEPVPFDMELSALDEQISAVQRVELSRALETEVVPVHRGVREVGRRQRWNPPTRSLAQGPDVDDGVALVDVVVRNPNHVGGQVMDLGKGRAAGLEQRGDDNVARRGTGLVEGPGRGREDPVVLWGSPHGEASDEGVRLDRVRVDTVPFGRIVLPVSCRAGDFGHREGDAGAGQAARGGRLVAGEMSSPPAARGCTPAGGFATAGAVPDAPAAEAKPSVAAASAAAPANAVESFRPRPRTFETRFDSSFMFLSSVGTGYSLSMRGAASVRLAVRCTCRDHLGNAVVRTCLRAILAI